jgi:hypothetical protein
MVRRGQVERVGRGWLLRGDPPGELLQLQPVNVTTDDQ